MIVRMSRMKPRSSIWSPSSRTKCVTWSSRSSRVLMRSLMRPGVPTTMSVPRCMRLDLRRAADAAEDDDGAEPGTGREAADALVDLQREFARRRQDQHAGAVGAQAAAVVQQVLDDRQGEGAGFAGAGLGDAEQVASGQKLRNGARLDGGRRRVAERQNGALDRLAEPQRGKAVGSWWSEFQSKESPRRPDARRGGSCPCSPRDAEWNR